jgi:hypothetical protein
MYELHDLALKAVSYQFGENFETDVDKRDWTVITHCFWVQLLRH